MDQERRTEDRQIRKDLSPEATQNPLSWVNYVKAIGRSTGIEQLLFRNYPEDTQQINCWIALEAAQAEREGCSKQKITRLIGKLYHQAFKQFGFKRNLKFYVDTNTRKEKDEEDQENQEGRHTFQVKEQKPEENYPRCGVPNCNGRGLFYDSKFEIVCENCYKFVKNRIKKGESDPYRDIEKDRKQDTKNVKKTSLIKYNQDFWDMIYKNLDQSAWQQLWRWGKGTQHKVDPKTLEEIRRTVISNLKNLSSGNLNYRMNCRNKKLVFLHLECLECGEKYELDVYKILQDKINFSYFCPCCSGIYSSQRLFRLQKLIEKLISRELDYQNAIKETGYSYGGLAILVSTYRKKGLEGLARKIGFPYFGALDKRNDSNLPRKIEKQLQSSIHPDNFV